MSDLYKKHLYINDMFDTLVNDQIIEYDLKSAGFNLIKQFKLMTPADIEYMTGLSNKDKQIFIGKMQRKTEGLSAKLNSAFTEARRWFFDKNKIEDNDVVSIKKDAIFVRRHCDQTEVGFLKFNVKNVYSSYLRIGKREFYYNPNTLDVKGVSDDKVELHRPYMLEFIETFIRLLETSTRKKQIQYLKDFTYFYKRRELDTGYYRELDNNSLFRLNDTLYGNTVGIEQMDDVFSVDISFNYKNYIIPMTSILI